MLRLEELARLYRLSHIGVGSQRVAILVLGYSKLCNAQEYFATQNDSPSQICPPFFRGLEAIAIGKVHYGSTTTPGGLPPFIASLLRRPKMIKITADHS